VDIKITGENCDLLRQIVKTIIDRHLSPSEVSVSTQLMQGSDLTEYLTDLEQSGFVQRDYQYKPGGNRGKLSRLRISDNYLRFYLKYIEPNEPKIENSLSWNGVPFKAKSPNN
jgi:uncharacterized protein